MFHANATSPVPHLLPTSSPYRNTRVRFTSRFTFAALPFYHLTRRAFTPAPLSWRLYPGAFTPAPLPLMPLPWHLYLDAFTRALFTLVHLPWRLYPYVFTGRLYPRVLHPGTPTSTPLPRRPYPGAYPPLPYYPVYPTPLITYHHKCITRLLSVAPIPSYIHYDLD